MSKIEMDFEVPNGTSLDNAAKMAVAMAKQKHKTVTFMFNETAVSAEENSKPDDVVEAWRAASRKKAEDYWNSPEGRARQAKQDEALRQVQDKMTGLLGSLDGALQQGMTATITWIRDYADIADNNRIDGKYREVSAKLVAAGYKSNEYRDSKTVKDNKEVFGRYIVGAMIAVLNTGMPPRGPGPCDEFLKMPDKPVAPVAPKILGGV